MSLRTRLLAGLAVLVLAAVASSGWVILAVARTRLEAAQETQARLVGEQALRLLRASFDPTQPLSSPANRSRLAGTAQALVDRGDAREVTVIDEAGQTVLGDDVDDTLKLARTGTLFVARRGPALHVYAPLLTLDGAGGAVRFRLGGDDVLQSALVSARYLLVSVALVDGVLVLLFGALFIRRVVGPLEALAGGAHRVAAGELHLPPLPVPEGADELARLTEAFNRMTTSLRAQRDHLVAQEKLATVGRLAAGVAHEVGNPLAAVLGYVDLLLHDEKDAERRDMLQRIHKETDRIRDIISDLLDYSRPVAAEREPVSLQEAVETSVSLLKPQARFRGVTVEDRVPVELPPASASASRLVQVLINLLLNAADAMHGEGTIEVAARQDGDRLELTVRDSGPGVAEADRGRIFDPFFTTKEPGQGTGLGLAVSRSIVQAFGGELVLVDGPTPGAVFAVRLPRWIP
jgi:signal transduction histidine kinase